MSDVAVNIRALETRATTWPARARDLEVDDVASMEFAGAMLVDIKALRAEIEACFRPMQDAAFAAHREICNQRKRVEQPLIDADKLLAPKMSTFLQAKETERRRLEAEATAAQRAADEAQRRAEAAALDQAGEAEAAELVRSQPPSPPVVMPSLTPKVDGIGSRTTWSCEVLSVKELCRGIADGIIPEDAVKQNQSVLDAAARAMKSSFKWPGCRARQTTGIVRRG